MDGSGLEDHRRLAVDLVRLAYDGRRLQVETGAPGLLAVELNRNREGVLLHLVNVNGDTRQPMGEILPLRDVEFSVKGTYRSARALFHGRKLKFSKAESGRVDFTVPLIGAYEIVVLEP